MPVDRLEIGLRRWHLHIVLRRHIEGAAAPDAEVDAGCLDQRVDRRLDQIRRRRWRGNSESPGKPFALRQVEDREAFQERDRLRLLPVSMARFFSSSGMNRSA